MKVVSYTALLYGTDYLGYAIRSIIDHVDEHHIIYSPLGAHGHRTNRPCPDTRDELYAIAEGAAGNKLRWHDAGPFAYEGQQRDSIHAYAPDADAILVLDADEIWPEWDFRNYAEGFANTDVQKRVRLPMIHFWRSFHRAVLHDPAYPERIIFPKSRWNHTGVLYPPRNRYGDHPNWFIGHFGYAQRSEIVSYKLNTHGHRNEFRRDVDWFNDRFMANAQHDCHPVGSDHWQPEAINPWDYLPEYMKLHPYANLDLIP